MALELLHYLLSNLPKTSLHSQLSAMSVIPQRPALDEGGCSQEDVDSVVDVVIRAVAEVNSRE